MRTEIPELTDRNTQAWIKALRRLCIVQEVERTLNKEKPSEVPVSDYKRVKAALQFVVAE